MTDFANVRMGVPFTSAKVSRSPFMVKVFVWLMSVRKVFSCCITPGVPQAIFVDPAGPIESDVPVTLYLGEVAVAPG